MTAIPARQPQGIPAGGQFAATTHSEPQITLPAGSTSIEEFIANRDAVRERRDEAREDYDTLDVHSQRLSARGVAATILAKYPNAATLRVSENQDGENQFDAISITAEDGTVLEHVDDGDEWAFQEMIPNAPQIQEFVWDFNPRDDRWAHKIGEITGGKRDFKTVDIDLHAALNASLPDEQKD
ncbi:hypothetical protein Achl_4198 (plasmid) [Pseudarthrobacter chlorophenolicus A6]|uniref:Uncharacterized protein n=1 Tax=Pseudarthrobacter chlorophenolicus (strain ATCC 700700 / DSM 12829 / CIP 107037 / JCM 12360 / KCTC 9906 / NCIMB 13794 / A6) TaxID=452863 RepID=B8HIA2_PSECP|nr:hypothetical protein [Pseudarthrobacter chlorophenolicus]ACL42149.1 hypothetical protein Achl_4198 [Pseudarthrobacter chlorophenolicus A6]SDQ14077.1 hypothetical protein SAMN04489738_0256 [Pseudarthrobacter chlorophenolicus]